MKTLEQTPQLSRAMQAGENSTGQLLEIAANEMPRGDLRDLLLGTAALIGKLSGQLGDKINGEVA